MTPPRHERGAALFAVLAAVALLAAFVSIGLAQLKAATARVSEATARNEAMLLAGSGATAARFLVFKLKGKKQPQGLDPARPVTFRLASGEVRLRFRAAGNCFNLNSLAPPPAQPGQPPAPPQARAEDFSRLLVAAGIPQFEAGAIADATASRLGESGLLWAEPSEWVTVKGVQAAHWRAAGHLLCALPNREAAAININELRLADAPLLAALGIAIDEARRTLAARPVDGWNTTDDFWAQAATTPPAGNAGAHALGTGSRWMLAELEVTTADARLHRQLLLDTARQPADIAAARWGTTEIPPAPREIQG